MGADRTFWARSLPKRLRLLRTPASLSAVKTTSRYWPDRSRDIGPPRYAGIVQSEKP